MTNFENIDNVNVWSITDSLMFQAKPLMYLIDKAHFQITFPERRSYRIDVGLIYKQIMFFTTSRIETL